MAEKNINNIRIVNKHDTEANWLKATGFTPKQGELIVYDKDSNYDYERIKIGDGTTNVNTLPFVDEMLIKSTGGIMTGALRTNGLLSNTVDGTYDSQIIVLPRVPYTLIGNSTVVSEYFTNLLVWICENYPGCENTIFIGSANPSARGTVIIHIYSTNAVDADSGLPSYSSGMYFPVSQAGITYTFGTYAHGFYHKSISTTDHTHKYAGSSTVGGAANSAVKATQDASGNVITSTYATKIELENVSDLVGDTSVSEQIEAAQIVYVGPTQPTDPNIKVWINTSEEGTGIVPVLPRVATITLAAASWTGSASPYYQTVSINTVTSATKIDLQPTVAQITSLQNADIALMAENTNGTVKVYSFGGKPSADMTMQALLTEVSYV